MLYWNLLIADIANFNQVSDNFANNLKKKSTATA